MYTGKVVGLAVYAIAFVVYILTADASLGWLDTPEFIGASAALGVAHSPGHPIALMLGKAATLIPLGDIPFRVNLASGALAAGAATAVFFLVRSLLWSLASSESGRRRPRDPRTIAAAAAAAGWISAFSWALWFQGVRAEVYGLQAALVLIALAAAVDYARAPQPRLVVLFAFASGLATANHHAIAATVLAPAALLMLHRQRPTARIIGLSVVSGLVGLASFLYLPVRAHTNPSFNWGAVDDWGRLWWTISGRAFHKTAAAEHVSSTGQDAAQALVAVVQGATIPLSLLALVGIYLALRNRRLLAPILTLVAVIGFALMLRAVLGFDPETPDHHAYLIPAVVALIALGVTALFQLAALLEVASRKTGPSALAAPIVAVCLILLAAVSFAQTLSRANLADSSAADRLTFEQLESLPPRTLLLSAYFETNFQLMSAREVFALRPDVEIIDRSFLTYPGMADSMSARHPDLASLIHAPLAAGARSPIRRLDELAQHRAVMVELHPNVDSQLAQHLVPLGAFARYLVKPELVKPELAKPEPIREQTATLDATAMERLTNKLAPPNVDNQGSHDTESYDTESYDTESYDTESYDTERLRMALLWKDFLRLTHYCRFGPKRAAADTVKRMRRYAPPDQTLDELIANCGLRRE